MNKKLINELISNYEINELERHLIFFYIKERELDIEKNALLSKYFESVEINKVLASQIERLKISSIKVLESYLELLIPENDRKLNGAFFTPTFIIDYIIKELDPKIDHRNLDPSCGCGAFLIGLTDFYKEKYSKSIRDIVKENIYGSDILKYNIERTKLLLTIYALQNGEILVESDFNLYLQDSLNAKWNLQFDNIVGNPPYVKFQDLPDGAREFLGNGWQTISGGAFNLYFAFFELGYELLKRSGKLGYITPNNYFTSLAAMSLRQFFEEKRCISHIIDFSHKKVFDALTYTAITFLSKSENNFIMFDRIPENLSPQEFLKITEGSPNSISDLNHKKWRLLKAEEQENIKMIETVGTSIGKLFDISVGIATLKDDVFFVDGSVEEGGFYIKKTTKGLFKIEKAATKSVLKISEIKTQDNVVNNRKRIIYPYDILNGVARPVHENEFKKRYPNCYDYLLSEKDALLQRDKGKKLYEPFYQWGRTQGLTKFGKKILTPTFSQKPRFLLAESEDSFFTNGYGIFYRESTLGESLFPDTDNPIAHIQYRDVLQKILNSYVMHYYITKTSVSIDGGYPCYQKNFIQSFTIPKLAIYEIEFLRSTNDKELIDEFLIEKYQLNILLGNLA